MRVLIVEDQPAVAKALRMLFDLNDIDAEATSSPDDAFRAVERGKIDLVVQDMNFTPGETSGEEGVALFRRLRGLDAELRILQSGEFERLGSSETRRVDVRVLCATNADLRQAIARGTFRQDLYFRLNVIEIGVPPLRERREDVMALAAAFLDPSKRLSRSAEAALREYDWPGNVRELQNRILRASVIREADELTPEDLGFGDSKEGTSEVPLERHQIEVALLNAQALIPFYTTKPTGSGLGLPLCNEIVEAHGGRMRLESGVAGTVVTVWLPD